MMASICNAEMAIVRILSSGDGLIGLTYLPLDKMDAILADGNCKCIFLRENDGISIRISLKFVPGSQLAKSQHWFR